MRGHPEHEEGGLHPELLEEREHDVRLALQGRAAPVPVRAAEPPVHQLVPILEVDAEEEHRTQTRAERGSPPTIAEPCVGSSPWSSSSSCSAGRRLPSRSRKG